MKSNRRVSLYRTQQDNPYYGGKTWFLKLKYLNPEQPREVIKKELWISDQSMMAILRLFLEHKARDGDSDAALLMSLL